MRQKEVKELSIDELNEKLISFNNELSEMKMTHAISPIENPMQIKNLRRTIARINTELTVIDLFKNNKNGNTKLKKRKNWNSN